MKILVIEDEKRLAKALRQILLEQKYMVDMVHDGNDGLDYALSGIYDVIILDIMLPCRDGFEVAQELRKNKIEMPILMLTAKDTIADKVTGLDRGADDYMTKPFEPEELLARVSALSRRTGDVIVDKIQFKDLSLNVNSAVLTCGSESVQLSHKEFEVLKTFLYNPTMTVTTDSLIVNVWGIESEATDNNVEVYISFIRKKLKYLKSNVSIKKIPRIGYRLEVKEC